MNKCKSTTLRDLLVIYKDQGTALRDRFNFAGRDPYDSVLINRSKLRPMFLTAPRGKAFWRIREIQLKGHHGINVAMQGDRV
ncbi:TPA: hypothetical protein ACODIZ_003631 [Salmonella enterica subsp. enterica serovar Newport]